MRQLPVTWAGPDGGLLEAAPTRPTKTHEWDSLGCHGLNCYFGNGTKNFQTFKKNLVASMREREKSWPHVVTPLMAATARAGPGWAGLDPGLHVARGPSPAAFLVCWQEVAL